MADRATRLPTADVTVNPDDERGYTRSGTVQDRFDEAVGILVDPDGIVDSDGHGPLRAELALEGGRVQGIGLVGAIWCWTKPAMCSAASPARVPGQSSQHAGVTA